jgi:hypothetical protein
VSTTAVARYRYDVWNDFVRAARDGTIPHCDSRILHHPDDCAYCDRPEWTKARETIGVEFTGRPTRLGFVSCEADASRPSGATNDHRRWAGNKPTSATGDPSWPFETAASQIFYGDKGGRAPWPIAERAWLRATRPYRRLRMRLRGWRREGPFWVRGES